MKRFREKLAQLLEQARESAQRDIPAGNLRDQVRPGTLPPATGSSSGGVILSDANPAGVGAAAAAPGTASDVSRSDHVHAPTNDLLALEGLSTTGLAARTATDTWALRSIAGTTNRIDVTNGDGVAGNPTLDISPSYVGQSSITTLGTITTGVWQGTAIAASFGGTGQSSYAVGDLLYASASTVLSKLADVATGNALISGGVTTAPAWGKIGLTTHVSGTLASANGGTGQSSYAVGDILYASGTTALSKLADVATGNALISGGVTTAPSWGKIGLTTHVSGILGVLNGGTGADLSGTGGANQFVRQSTAGGAFTVTTIFASDIPGLDASKITTGLFGLARGGTGADLSSTGGTAQYLKQATPGGVITVGQIPYSDLVFSGLTAGQVWRATSATSAVFGSLDLSNSNAVANALAAANGGTGQSSYAVGDLLYASASTVLSKLADVATGNALISGGVTTAPAWGKIGLTTHVSGTLASANGGTDQSSYAVGDILYASGTTALSKLADVATGNALISGGVTTAPSWGKIGLTTHVSGILPSANGGTGIDNGGRTLTVNTNSGTLDFLSASLTLSYDEQSWTPTYQGETTGGSTTYSLQVGRYRRYGKLIVAAFTMVWTAASGTGIALFSLPVAPSSVTNLFQSGAARVEAITFANSTPGVNITPGVASFKLLSPTTNAAGTNVAVEAAGNIAGTIAYLTD